MLGTSVFPAYKPPAKHTGEDFGVLYLYRQTGNSFICKGQDLDLEIDEGFEDFTEDEPLSSTALVTADPTVVAPAADENSDEEEVIVHHISLVFIITSLSV